MVEGQATIYTIAEWMQTAQWAKTLDSREFCRNTTCERKAHYYFFAGASAASGKGHTTETIHATTIPTTHPNKTSPIRLAPASSPFLRDSCAIPADMTKAALIGACRHMV